ncbi:Hypothetical protein NocV09_06100010 [Nannochloropsis oceanica]
MHSFVTSRVTRLLATVVALCFMVTCGHIIVEDNFVDDTARKSLLAQLPAQVRFRHTLELPGQLYERLVTVLNPIDAARTTAPTFVPASGKWDAVAAHKDSFGDKSLVGGQVGLVYLEGDGHILFQHEVTGKKTVVDVKPGRFLSWDNEIYTHTLIPGNMPRRLLGPMAFRGGGMQCIGTAPPESQTKRVYYMIVKKDDLTKTFLFDSLVPQLEDWCHKITLHVTIGIVSANCTTALIESSSKSKDSNAIDILNGLPEVVTLISGLPDPTMSEAVV